MTHSDAIDALAPALATAQAACATAVKDATNPHFKSTYASLASIWDACREALKANNLAVLQSCETDGDGTLHLVTTLLHSSGQWWSVRVLLPLEKPSVQAVGSAITYGRRYGLANAMGIVAEDDDDGEHAQTHTRTTTPARAPAPSNGALTLADAAKVLWGKERIALGDLRNSAVTQARDWSVQKIEDEGEQPNLLRIRDAAKLILAARERGELTEPPKTSKARGTFSPRDPAPPSDPLADADDDLPF